MPAHISPAVAAAGGVLPPRKCARHFLRRSILASNAEQLGDQHAGPLNSLAQATLRVAAVSAQTPWMSAHVRPSLVQRRSKAASATSEKPWRFREWDNRRL